MSEPTSHPTQPPKTTGPAHFPRGLEGIAVSTSSITLLDGVKGRMVYRGYDCLDLAGKTSFEEVTYLLWNGELPTRTQLDSFSKQFLPYRAVPAEIVETMRRLPLKTHPMDVLRLTVAEMGIRDAGAQDNSLDANKRKAVILTARLASVAAIWDRIRKNLPLVEPDLSLGHSANFLYMLTGRRPDEFPVQALDMYLALLADHDMNASTFTARVVVSTLSDMYSAICAAIGTLKGPLHGGANEKAMEMFLEIGSAANAVPFIEKALAEKKKIMGFGHRIYKVEDPRSIPLKDMSRRLSEYKKNMTHYDVALQVADVVGTKKKLYTNVDFYSAPLLYLLDIPTDMFTAMFAVSRIAGWTAHVIEQIQDNRLIRPITEYTGPSERRFTPIEKR